MSAAPAGKPIYLYWFETDIPVPKPVKPIYLFGRCICYTCLPVSYLFIPFSISGICLISASPRIRFTFRTLGFQYPSTIVGQLLFGTTCRTDISKTDISVSGDIDYNRYSDISAEPIYLSGIRYIFFIDVPPAQQVNRYTYIAQTETMEIVHYY